MSLNTRGARLNCQKMLMWLTLWKLQHQGLWHIYSRLVVLVKPSLEDAHSILFSYLPCSVFKGCVYTHQDNYNDDKVWWKYKHPGSHVAVCIFHVWKKYFQLKGIDQLLLHHVQQQCVEEDCEFVSARPVSDYNSCPARRSIQTCQLTSFSIKSRWIITTTQLLLITRLDFIRNQLLMTLQSTRHVGCVVGHVCVTHYV